MNNVFNVSEDVLKLAIALSRPIEELELSHRSWNCLRRWGLYTVGDVCKAYYEGKLPKIRNIGPKSIYEIEHAIDKHLLKWRLKDE